jgi:hypothetical protein
VTGWLVPYVGQKIPLQPGWYLPLQKIPLAENRFLFRQVRELEIQRKKFQVVLYSLWHPSTK